MSQDQRIQAEDKGAIVRNAAGTVCLSVFSSPLLEAQRTNRDSQNFTQIYRSLSVSLLSTGDLHE